jgi:hypothetical protein
VQQCIQPTGTNRPRAWRPTRARARFGTLRGCGNAASRVALPVNTGGRARRSARFPVAMAAGKHPFPFRTRQLSPPAPMVLGGRPPGRVGRRRDFSRNPLRASARGGFVRSGHPITEDPRIGCDTAAYAAPAGGSDRRGGRCRSRGPPRRRVGSACGVRLTTVLMGVIVAAIVLVDDLRRQPGPRPGAVLS